MGTRLQINSGTHHAHARRLATANMPRVFVIDDDSSVRESLESLFRFEGWHVEACASARDFLERPTSRAPGCVVLDVGLPDLSGLELQERLKREQSYLPIIFISGYGDVRMTVTAMKAGAVEFLTKPLSHDTLLRAVGQALTFSRAALDHEESLAEIRSRYNSLTPRERQVMAHVVEGSLNKQIAAALGVSEITVKAHRGRMTRKMRADTVPQLVRLATRLSTPYVRADAPQQ